MEHLEHCSVRKTPLCDPLNLTRTLCAGGGAAGAKRGESRARNSYRRPGHILRFVGKGILGKRFQPRLGHELGWTADAIYLGAWFRLVWLMFEPEWQASPNSLMEEVQNKLCENFQSANRRCRGHARVKNHASANVSSEAIRRQSPVLMVVRRIVSRCLALRNTIPDPVRDHARSCRK